MFRGILLTSTLLGVLAVACSTTTTTQSAPNDHDGDSGASGEDSTVASGTGGTTHSNGTGGAAPSGTGSSADLSCASYCRVVQTNCATETVKQYKSDESCTSSCAAFLLGSVKDTSGNTLGCRAQYATLAAIDPAANCAAAGPSGGGRCGTNCDAYCALMARVCPTVFDDDASCRSACRQMAGVDDVAYRSATGGDTLQCRIYHATFGAEGFPELHCPHASPVPTMPCAS